MSGRGRVSRIVRPVLLGGLGAVCGTALLWRLDTASLPLATLKHRYAMPNSRFPLLAGTPTHVVDQGSGPAVVMLHGNNNSLRLWDRWADALTARGFRVLRFDLPPYGLSGPSPSGRYGVVPTYEALADLLDEAGIASALLVGTANGGPPAAWYAYTHPSRVSGLVLINTPFLAPRDGLAKSFDTQRWLSDTVYKRVGRPRPATGAYVRTLLGDRPGSAPPGFVRHIHDLARRADMPFPLRAYGSSFSFASTIHNPDALSNAEMLGRLKVPVLVMWGGESLLTEAEGHQLAGFLFAAPHSFRLYPHAGHWLPIADDPAPLDDVLAFARAHAGGAAR